MRYCLFASLCLLGLNADAAATTRNGVFCQRGDHRLNILAARILQNGDLEFGLSKWEGSQSFSLFGVAKRSGSRWVYTQRDPEWTYDRRGQQWEYVGNNRTRSLTCLVNISWDSKGSISLIVDAVANCPGDAGYGFRQKSSYFTARDHLKNVTFELNDSETFLSARTAQGC